MSGSRRQIASAARPRSPRTNLKDIVTLTQQPPQAHGVDSQQTGLRPAIGRLDHPGDQPLPIPGKALRAVDLSDANLAPGSGLLSCSQTDLQPAMEAFPFQRPPRFLLSQRSERGHFLLL